MIRMNPCHDTKNPPGQHYEKPLYQQIHEYKEHELYKLGWQDGYTVGMLVVKQPQTLLNSEYSR
jgi:hypothetical protein